MTKAIAPIRVSEAHVTTATVDLQVIRIGAKQMTLAVFRQLPEKNIFTSSGRLAAPVWGWVNYDCAEGWRSYVFSLEGALYRTRASIKFGRSISVSAYCEETHEPSSWRGGKFNPEKTIRTPTGEWIIQAADYHRVFWSRDGWSNNLIFDSEEQARSYVQNRQESLGELEDAPQLYIGV